MENHASPLFSDAREKTLKPTCLRPTRPANRYGATGHRIESTEGLLPTFESAFEAGGVHLIDVPVDYSENQKVLIDELTAKACLI